MEAILRLLVMLVIIAGIVWVISPIVGGAISGGISRSPDLRIADQEYEITPIPDTECFHGMCEIKFSGKLYNFGGDGKNVLITILFFDRFNKNIGSVNMPLIESIRAQQTKDILLYANFSCEAESVSASVMHSLRA